MSDDNRFTPRDGGGFFDAATGAIVFPRDGQTPEDAIFEAGAAVNAPASADDLKAFAADKRWRVETGGIVRMGLTVPTDDRAKLLLLGASSEMADEDTAPFNVGTASVVINGAQFKALYGAVVAHVQACMARQTEIMAAIDAGTITTTAQIEAASWPT